MTAYMDKLHSLELLIIEEIETNFDVFLNSRNRRYSRDVGMSRYLMTNITSLFEFVVNNIYPFLLDR